MAVCKHAQNIGLISCARFVQNELFCNICMDEFPGDAFCPFSAIRSSAASDRGSLHDVPPTVLDSLEGFIKKTKNKKRTDADLFHGH